jgi:hypothetical protein
LESQILNIRHKNKKRRENIVSTKLEVSKLHMMSSEEGSVETISKNIKEGHFGPISRRI